MNANYCKIRLFDGRVLFAVLAGRQLHGYCDTGSSEAEIHTAYEDRDGEIVMHDGVFSEDIDVVMEED